MSSLEIDLVSGGVPDYVSLYRSIFERSADGIAIIAPDGTYVEQNDAHARLVGYSTDELRRQTPAVHLGEAAFADIRRRLDTDGYFFGTVESRDRFGMCRTVQLSAFPVYDRRGVLLAFVGAKRDISQRVAVEQELRRRYEQLEAIYRMSTALARATDLNEIFREGLDSVCRALASERAAILLSDDDGVMRFHAWRGLSSAYRAAVEGHSPWSPDEPAPAPIVVQDAELDRSLNGVLPTIRAEGIRGLVFIPLLTEARLLGKFMVYFAEPRTLSAEELRIATTIADHVAFAIQRQRALVTIERAEARQRLLAEVAAAVGSRIDYRDSLADVAELVVRSPFAAGCAIHLLNAAGGVDLVAARARAPHHAGILTRIDSRFANDPSGRAGYMVALRTGRAQLYPCIGEEHLRAAALDDEHLRLWRALELRSGLCAPLLARGRSIGVISLSSHDDTIAYAEADLPFAEELAGRIAIGIDNLRLLEEATAASRTKSDFMATMSHELRTPLNAIMGYADLLDLEIAGALTAGQRDQLGRIRASTDHLLTVIEQILTFSRVDAGREDTHVEALDALATAREAAAMVQPAAAAKGLSFALDLPERTVTVRGDALKLRQILLNVLGNAIKFTDCGSVSLAVRQQDGNVLYEVRDTGIGIATEHIDRIFEPFWQVDGSARRRTGGTGLGLTVSRQLTALLFGDLTVESDVGSGSVFRITLPAG